MKNLIRKMLLFMCVAMLTFAFTACGNSDDAEPAAVEEETVQEEDLTDDLELVAVISAAIAASEGTSTDGFVVRSIKKRRKNSQWK